MLDTIISLGNIVASAALGLFAPSSLKVDWVASPTSKFVVAQRVSSCAGASVVTSRVPASNEFGTGTGNSFPYAATPEACPVSAKLLTESGDGWKKYQLVEVDLDDHPRQWQSSLADANRFWLRNAGCATVAPATAPGMSGIVPASCKVRAHPATRKEEMVRTPPNASAVARILNTEGQTAGTAMLVAKDIVLTAAHVLYGDGIDGRRSELSVAQFLYVLGEQPEDDKLRPFALQALEYRNSQAAPCFSFWPPWYLHDASCSDAIGSKLGFGADDTGRPPSLARIVEYEISGPIAKKIADGEASRTPKQKDDLDYIFLKLRCDKEGFPPCPDGRYIQPVSIFDAENRLIPLAEPVHILGFTDNVFFPRGMILSTNGHHWEYEAEECKGSGLCYDNQTNHGFSGGPVFDNSFNLIAMHTSGLRFKNLTSTELNQKLDLELPNRATRISAIAQDVKTGYPKSLKCELFGYRDEARKCK